MMRAVPVAQRWLIALVALSLPLSAWGAVYPPNSLLQLGPVLLVVLVAIPLLTRFPLSTGSVACIASFLLLHDLAARWTYSDVPYDHWAQAIAGISIDRTFGFTRNMFDRLVHFSYGLVAIRPVSEIARRHFHLGRGAALYAALSFVLATGALYEMFEWLLAVFMDPASADAYNGQQGDMFDSQKDMAIAALGGSLSTIFLALRGRVVRNGTSPGVHRVRGA
jgi:putative membrane protein